MLPLGYYMQYGVKDPFSNVSLKLRSESYRNRPLPIKRFLIKGPLNCTFGKENLMVKSVNQIALYYCIGPVSPFAYRNPDTFPGPFRSISTADAIASVSSLICLWWKGFI